MWPLKRTNDLQPERLGNNRENASPLPASVPRIQRPPLWEGCKWVVAGQNDRKQLKPQ